ncbi:hypothetical protein [Calothrix sp. 336/3]|uniref:hypothetical protein n=1 Tax=Calothrix sp. 336/3 TaxID=1337936 RepID=UPI000AB7CA3B|nr:hypothetical protein [Calothrix sp. 336/3]
MNLGEIDISGTVTNAINELPPATQPEKPGIKELLIKLKHEIESNSELTIKQKEKAQTELKKLSEAGLKPDQSEMQNIADNAITMLKGIVSGLPSTIKLLELLPEVAKIFSLTF